MYDYLLSQVILLINKSTCSTDNLCDIKHGTQAKKDDGPYVESHMGHADWMLNRHGVIILQSWCEND